MISVQEKTAEPTLRVSSYDDRMCSAWDDFVLREPSGTFFHLSGWKRVVEKEFGFEPRYLVAEDETGICGVLPLFLVSNRIQGKSLISTPFAVYGGVCARNDAVAARLRQAACHMAQREQVQYLELRERNAYHDAAFCTKDLYVSFDQLLPSTPEHLLQGFPRDTRYMIRRAQKEGLRAVVDNAQLEKFYDIYASSVRHLGTPVFSLRWFRTLAEEFGDMCEITTVWQGNTAVSAVLSFRFRDAVLPYYGGSLPEARKFAANNFMYFEVMKRALDTGLRYFDFGRSKKGTGAYAFKSQWNMQERSLPYQFFLVKRKDMPNFSPANTRFQSAIWLWKKVPLPLTKMLGPSLVRLFP